MIAITARAVRHSGKGSNKGSVWHCSEVVTHSVKDSNRHSNRDCPRERSEALL